METDSCKTRPNFENEKEALTFIEKKLRPKAWQLFLCFDCKRWHVKRYTSWTNNPQGFKR